MQRKPTTLPTCLLYEKLVYPVYRKRVAKYVSAMCEGNAHVLDVGCNDGSVSAMIAALKPSLRIEGIDVQADWPCKVKRTIYDGRKIPFADNSFDVVIAIDVLHHTTDIQALLKEMKRVTKECIIIKDHTARGPVSRFLLSLNDVAANFHYGIACTFNYPSYEQWHSYFKQLRLKVVEEPRGMAFGFGLNEWLNPIFKLKKIRRTGQTIATSYKRPNL